MATKNGNRSKGFWYELRLIFKRARNVWRLVPRRHKLALGGAVLIMVLGSACNTAIPVLLGRLVDEGTAGINRKASVADLEWMALLYLGLIAGVYLVREMLQVVRRYMVENSCTRLQKLLMVKVVFHLMKADLSTLAQDKVGSLQGKISRSVLGFVRFLRISFLDFFPAIFLGLFALGTAITKQPWVGLVMVGIIPVSFFLTVRQLISQKGIRLSLMRSLEAMDGTVVEMLSGIDYVRAANTEEREIHRVALVAERRRAKELRHHFQMSLFGCGKALTEGLFYVAVLGLALFLAVRGVISTGDILMFSMLFLSVMAPLNEIHRVLDEGHECSLQVGDLLEMMSEPVDKSFSPNEVKEPQLEVGRPVLEVKNLHVRYQMPDGQEKHALKGVSLTIRHGETVGVAGKSGCGKSTWLRVLLRLTEPCEGRALVGGVPLESVAREAIGRLIGYVGQTPFVFSGTIAENITYGMENISEEQMIRAAKMACIHDEIMAMPGGYQAEVKERGQNLSGGQRQRLALARIFLKDPPILILDEGTSALDNISERTVQQAILAARQDRTVILVAHRLSTLLDADRIFVFDDGRIVETGTYKDLLHRGGTFTELVRHAQEGVAARESLAAAG